MDVAGAPVLPGWVDAHAHLDKAYTLPRARPGRPGLLGAIEAVIADRPRWTEADLRQRITRGLVDAFDAGTRRLRTHVDWPGDEPPLAWSLLAEIANTWRDRMRVESVALVKLQACATASQARAVAQRVRATQPDGLLGGFVHSSQWDAQALTHLMEAAAEAGIGLDLHVDEELNPNARGLITVARRARTLSPERRVVCGHVCALAAMPEKQALDILDEVARAPITLVSLPITNLLLQDANTGRTPRLRGITLVKEARARGIPLLFASDNVQDPFCAHGSHDPMEAMQAAVLAAQLDAPFDRWSDTLCRDDWLDSPTAGGPVSVGRSADLVIFPEADAFSWPSRTARRRVLRRGVPVLPLLH